MARLNWYGDDVIEHVTESVKEGVDRTVEECVDMARTMHEWVNRSGALEGSIWVMQGATSRGGTVVARWGSDDPHALEVEIGTSRVGPRVLAREQAASGNMWEIPSAKPNEGVTVTQPFTLLPPGTMKDQRGWVTAHRPSQGTGPLMGARPFLRPAASMHYRLLASRCRAAFQGMRMP